MSTKLDIIFNSSRNVLIRLADDAAQLLREALGRDDGSWQQRGARSRVGVEIMPIF
jgi:hypothetical protein